MTGVTGGPSGSFSSRLVLPSRFGNTSCPANWSTVNRGVPAGSTELYNWFEIHGWIVGVRHGKRMHDPWRKCRRERVLLIGSTDPFGDRRACVLREHGVLVDVVRKGSSATAFWRRTNYDLILIDVPKHLPGEVVDLTRQIRSRHSHQRIAFLLGAPLYISEDWPDEMVIHRDVRRPAHETARAAAGGVR